MKTTEIMEVMQAYLNGEYIIMMPKQKYIIDDVEFKPFTFRKNSEVEPLWDFVKCDYKVIKPEF